MVAGFDQVFAASSKQLFVGARRQQGASAWPRGFAGPVTSWAGLGPRLHDDVHDDVHMHSGGAGQSGVLLLVLGMPSTL